MRGSIGIAPSASLAALSDFFNLEDDEFVFRAATALSGGTAGMGDGNCGAYSGGILSLGLMYGRERLALSRCRSSLDAFPL